MFSEKTLKESLLCLILTTLAKIEKGGVRVKDIKNNVPSLESNGTIMYNNFSGSIQSKEGL